MEEIKGFFAKIGDFFKRYVQAFKMNGEVRKRTLLYGGIAIAAILLIILLCLLVPGGNKTVEPAEPVEENEVKEDDVVRVEPEPVKEPADMVGTFKKYSDVFAWIEIPGTAAALQIDSDTSLPVALAPEGDRFKYLESDLDLKTTKAGTLFAESECEGKPMNNRDLSDPVTVIYGHNMANRTMFGGLQTYLKNMDFSTKPTVIMYQEGRRVTYQIVGGVQYGLEHILYYHETFTLGGQEYLKANGLSEADLETAKEEDWNDFFNGLYAETDSFTNIDKENWVKLGDKVLILSVCKNGDNTHRYLIVCKMIEDTEDPTTWQIDEAATAKKQNETAKKTENKTK